MIFYMNEVAFECLALETFQEMLTEEGFPLDPTEEELKFFLMRGIKKFLLKCNIEVEH